MNRGKRATINMFMAAAALAAVAVGVPLASAAESAAPQQYVALGDSSAAGPGIPTEIDRACQRSDRNWPHVLAAKVGATLTDVTCTGATLSNNVLSTQIKALNEDTDLVTLAVGGNDVALSQAFSTCYLGRPDTRTCQQIFSSGSGDVFDSRIAAFGTSLRNALQQISGKAPNADIILTGYLTYWKKGGCPEDGDPYGPADADYIQGKFDKLMTTIASVAATHPRTKYVDIRTPSAENGLCELPAKRWLEGITPASPALAYHPNATGMAEAAAIIAAAVPAG